MDWIDDARMTRRFRLEQTFAAKNMYLGCVCWYSAFNGILNIVESFHSYVFFHKDEKKKKKKKYCIP